MRKLGWSGSGGLGKMKNGIVEPIHVSIRTTWAPRREVGLNFKDFQKEAKPICVVKTNDLISDDKKMVKIFIEPTSFQNRGIQFLRKLG